MEEDGFLVLLGGEMGWWLNGWSSLALGSLREIWDALRMIRGREGYCQKEWGFIIFMYVHDNQSKYQRGTGKPSNSAASQASKQER